MMCFPILTSHVCSCSDVLKESTYSLRSSFVTYISFYITQKQPHLTSSTSSPRCVFRPQVSSPFMCKLQHQLTNCLLLDIRLCSAASHMGVCALTGFGRLPGDTTLIVVNLQLVSGIAEMWSTLILVLLIDARSCCHITRVRKETRNKLYFIFS